MIFIGERINAGFKDIRAAIENKDADPIKAWAVKQTKAGATYLDVNMGTASNKPEDLCWMIESVQDAVETPISIDNNRPTMIKEALPVCKKPPLINSLTADETKLDEMLPIIKEADASFIGLVMDEEGSPKDANKRVENAGRIMAKIMEYEIDPEKLFLDPIIMPLKFMQEQATEIMTAASQFTLFTDPPCHIVGGLSNVANGTKHKKLINRIFATMLVANGLDAVSSMVRSRDMISMCCHPFCEPTA